MEKIVATPHISCAPSDFAKTVLMPGDPRRSAFIAREYLSDSRLVNGIRGVEGYTGTYRGTRVSVMASGMGMPSIAIYSHELFNFFGVENIIRVGSAGGFASDLKVRDLVFGQGACTDSNYASAFGLPGTFAPICDYSLLVTAVAVATEKKLSFKVGNLLSTDAFYADAKPNGESAAEIWGKMGVLAVEMESAALYMNAARAGKRALAICTVSDHLLTGESLPASERETSFTDMMETALETACRISK